MQRSAAIRVVLAEDEPKLAFALRMLLDLEPRVELIGVVGDGREAVDVVLELRPDVIVLDVGLEGLDGIAAGEQILRAWPEARIVVYSGDEDALPRARKAGFEHALLKGALAAELLAAIEDACEA